MNQSNKYLELEIPDVLKEGCTALCAAECDAVECGTAVCCAAEWDDVECGTAVCCAAQCGKKVCCAAELGKKVKCDCKLKCCVVLCCSVQCFYKEGNMLSPVKEDSLYSLLITQEYTHYSLLRRILITHYSGKGQIKGEAQLKSAYIRWPTIEVSLH